VERAARKPFVLLGEKPKCFLGTPVAERSLHLAERARLDLEGGRF
jgi:hypothetical protein